MRKTVPDKFEPMLSLAVVVPFITVYYPYYIVRPWNLFYSRLQSLYNHIYGYRRHWLYMVILGSGASG